MLVIVTTGYKLIILFLGLLGFNFFASNPPANNFEIGNNKFYRGEIYKTTGIKLSENLLITAKLDTIYYGGMEGEYDAECIFYGSAKDIKNISNLLTLNHGFVLLRQEQIQQIPDQSKLGINITKFKTWFYKMEDGKYDIYIGLNNNQIFYDAWYY